jgi:hypothetical protein
MKKIILAAAVAMVAGTPLAFAANYGNMGDTEPSSRHCTYPGEKWDICRQDRHMDNQSKGGIGSHRGR